MTSPVVVLQPKKPLLWRLARYIRWAGIVAVILVFLYILSVLYSAVVFATSGNDIQVANNSNNGGGGNVQEVAPGQFQGRLQVNITNPSLYPMVMDITMSSIFVNGPYLGGGTSGAVTIGSHQEAPVLVTYTLLSSAFERQPSLMTNDTTITGTIWLNGTYATIFTFAIVDVVNATWGAPFQGLDVVPQAPLPPSGGVITVPVAVNFTDDAQFDDSGSIAIQVVQANGQACGSPTSFSVSDPTGDQFMETEDVSVPDTCDLSGAHVESVYTDGSLVIDLPTEALP